MRKSILCAFLELYSVQFKKVIFLSVTLISLFTINLTAQNVLYDDDESGFGLGVQLTNSSSSTLLAFSPNYTTDGKWTIGLGLGGESTKSGNTVSSAVMPYVSYMVVKADRYSPISVDVTASYQYNTFEDNEELTVSTARIGGTAYYEIETRGDVRFLPHFSVVYGSVEVKQNEWNLGKSSGIGYGIGGSIAWDKFYCTPHLALNGNKSFTLLFGWTWGK